MSRINVSKDMILKSVQLNDSEVLNIFPYGSQVYGTHTDKSDYDFIIILNKDVQEFSLVSDDGQISVHIYSPDEFINQLQQHKIAALECFFLPQELLLKNKLKFFFPLNKNTLRASISEKASHSWVKSKKKFEMEIDQNIYIAKKSLFHALRIIDFGTQISQYSKIIDYSSSNFIWDEIKDEPNDRWSFYKNKYQTLFNNRMTEFRKITPLNK